MGRMNRLGMVLVAGLLLPASTLGVSIGQIDTFEDGTTQGWQINLLGLGAPPVEALPANISTGGPAGVDDNYLRLTALGGSGSGSRLSAINVAQWGGDYLAGGVTALKMDAINLGATDLSLRLLFADPQAGPPDNQAFSTTAVLLPAGGGWTSLTFPISVAGLTAVTGNATGALSNVTELRIFHSVPAEFPPGPVVASLGLDNIQAVPEPAAILLLGCALPRLLRRRRR